MKRIAAETIAFLRSRAEQMRQNPTRSERAMRAELEPLGFEAQSVLGVARVKHPERIDYHILDFYHPKALLCIEMDGGYHRGRNGPDRRRDVSLGHLGIVTMRFRAEDAENPEKLGAIVALVKMALDGLALKH